MAQVNANNRWVKILRTTSKGFVEFEFSVSDTSLYVELILPEAAFHEFCAINRVRLLEGDASAIASAGGLLQRIK